MRLALTRRAREDLARVYDFNLKRSETWAARVQDRLLERAYALTTVPGVGRPLRERGVFRLSVTDIQYVIDYEVGDDFIRIVRVLHTREVK